MVNPNIPEWFNIDHYKTLNDEREVSELGLYFQLKARFDIYQAVSFLLQSFKDTDLKVSPDFLPKKLKPYWKDIITNGLITPPISSPTQGGEIMLQRYAAPTHPLDITMLYGIHSLGSRVLTRIEETEGQLEDGMIQQYFHDQDECQNSKYIYFKVDLNHSNKTLMESFEKNLVSLRKSGSGERKEPKIDQFKKKIDNIRKYQIIPLYDLFLWMKFSNVIPSSEIADAISTDLFTVTREALGMGNDGKVKRLFDQVNKADFLKEWRASLDKNHFKEKAISEISLTLLR
jgi:hypothetical protein